MSMLARINGVAATHIALTDRGLQFGDGVFRTLRIDDGRIAFWQRHSDKLAQDALALGITPPPAQFWLDEIAALGLRDATLKLIITRGNTPRGYAWPADLSANCIVQAHAGPAHRADPAGLKLCVCQTPATWQPRLAGIKHLNRLENVLARAEIAAAGCDEGVLLDRDGAVVEGCMSNILLLLHDQHGPALITPPLHDSGVAGVMRSVAIDAAAQLGWAIRLQEIRLPDVLAAAQVWLSNSLLGVQYVSGVGRQIWTPTVHHAALQQSVRALLSKEWHQLLS
ncbi:aminodeoxychorismate lyase [Amantichitinum ursilacus]|uniref:aminodeoxychorismate lyase n=1 Tax=Amantichitinum ursilacus TaxID=857265 RepID=A0A0N1JT47_9NEIS|nr:aminodeoxychorismate lyase [Amantichitinum ursilacus]KPC53259.1 Aminodeoxychorismate lyase [Amantichitinum ursilacus]